MLGLAVPPLPSASLQDGSGELRYHGGYAGLLSVHCFLVHANLWLASLVWTPVSHSLMWIWFRLVFWGTRLVPITESHGFQLFAPHLQFPVLLWVPPLGYRNSWVTQAEGTGSILRLSSPLLPQRWHFYSCAGLGRVPAHMWPLLETCPLISCASGSRLASVSHTSLILHLALPQTSGST